MGLLWLHYVAFQDLLTGLPASPCRMGAEPSNPLNVTPEFIRLPKPGTLCRWTGLSRSKLNELILPSPLNSFKPPVRSLRNRGQIMAVRLIVLDSLLGYLRSLLEQQSTESQGSYSTACGAS